MSIIQHKAVERRMVEEALNKGNLAVVGECLTASFAYHGPGGKEVSGVEGYKEFIAGLRDGYPDIQVEIKDILAEGNLVATRTLCTFTFAGPAGKDVPTGHKVSITGAILDRFEGGKIAETCEQYDRLDLLQQLGLIPHQPTPPS